MQQPMMCERHGDPPLDSVDKNLGCLFCFNLELWEVNFFAKSMESKSWTLCIQTVHQKQINKIMCQLLDWSINK